MHTYVPSWLSAENLPVGSEIEEDAVCHITGGDRKSSFLRDQSYTRGITSAFC